MDENLENMEDIDSASIDSIPDYSDDDALSIDSIPDYSSENESNIEKPLTEEEIEQLIAELLEVESKAAEAQESLEDESLANLEAEVREELSQSLNGDDLEKAIADEMSTFKEEWEAVLDELEAQSGQLLEQLDSAGIELPSLYKWIESQAHNGCCTEAWKKRIHWVGSQVTNDVTESIADAEKYLQIHRPVRKRHGKTLEEGASGFLGKKLPIDDGKETKKEKSDLDWSSINKIFSDCSSDGSPLFGSKHWASVYLASTPQQAAELGLKFPGVDEVDEIDDIEGSCSDPLVAGALANERELNLSGEQNRNFRKVKEEDDAKVERKLQLHLKRRLRNRCKKEVIQKEVSLVDSMMESSLDGQGSKDDVSNSFEKENSESDGAMTDLVEPRGSKRMHDNDEVGMEYKKGRTLTIESCDGALVAEDRSASPTCNASELMDPYSLPGKGNVSIPGSSLPSQSLTQNYHCTACDKVVNDVHSHPLLKVIVCWDCKCFMEAKLRVKDPDCSESYCGWCGQNSDLVGCGTCKTVFCTMCIKRNLGDELLLEAQTSGWQCCCCFPRVLQGLTSQLEEVIELRDMILSSSDSDSETDVNVMSSKRRQKKKIRRILDDAELGEETKKKIAIEKERQERLKSLGAQFSTKTVMMSSTTFIANLSENSGIEVLGDASTGYIVNVVREEGEEIVRIPPSISAKLKAHQVAGIRFMWENIIESVRKVKSGDKGLGCILAHTMGLGKTFQVIAFLYGALRSVDLGLKTALIVTPVSVLHNWRHEFMKWRPSELKPLRVFMLEDVLRERRAELLAKWRYKGGVFLIGYAAFRNLSLGKYVKDRDMAREICRTLQDGPDILVCDEAHMIKNTRAEVTQALKQVKCQRRIALTGSPLQNNLMEYYCMVDFVREGFLGSSHEFRNRFQNPIENGQHTNSTSDDVKIMNQRSHILYEQLKGFVQRMDMSVVKKDLPPKTVFVIAVKLSPLQRKLYKRFLDVHGFRSDSLSSEKIKKLSFLAGYQALAQICNHPGILQLMKEDKDNGKREDAVENDPYDSYSDDNIDYNIVTGDRLKSKNEFSVRKTDNGFIHEDWWNDLIHENNHKEVDYSGKMVLLRDILVMCSDVGDKALVFSQSLSTLDLIELYLSKLPRPEKKGKCWKRGKDWYRLDGRTECSERQKLVERFNEPLNKRVKCTLISTRAGSLGINLHAANRVVIVDGSWNPTYDLQAIYRAWRYGQKKPVFAYRLMAHGTMEEKIYKRQVTKEGLAARVVDRQQVYRTISKEEMLHLFDFGDDESHGNFPKQGKENGHVSKQNGTGQVGGFSSDNLMDGLISRHYPRWIANYHEHETLLQENEDEKLSKEEQDMAWEVYQRSLEWEEVQRAPLDESAMERKPLQRISVNEASFEQKPTISNKIDAAPPADTGINLANYLGSTRNRVAIRKCTNLSHLLTLRSQGTKIACSTICGECGREISREDLNRDSKSVR